MLGAVTGKAKPVHVKRFAVVIVVRFDHLIVSATGAAGLLDQPARQNRAANLSTRGVLFGASLASPLLAAKYCSLTLWTKKPFYIVLVLDLALAGVILANVSLVALFAGVESTVRHHWVTVKLIKRLDFVALSAGLH
jgi:hypothetical protein